MIRDRLLPKVEFSNKPFAESRVMALKQQVCAEKGIEIADANYYVFSDSVKNKAYNLDEPAGNMGGFNIKILFKNGELVDIAKASDQYNIEALAKPVTKYFLCYPKNVIFTP